MRRGWVGSPAYRAAIQVLVECRTEAGLTQRALAARIGRPPSFVGKVEAGERRLDIIEFVEWARALNVPPDELMRITAASIAQVIASEGLS